MDKKLSLLIFSGEYDKALAGLILANSAKELGRWNTNPFKISRGRYKKGC